MKKNRYKLAITIGDPSGIGPEIVLKSFTMQDFWELGVPLVCGDYTVLESVRETLEIPVFIVPVENIADVENFPSTRHGLPTVPVFDQKIITDINQLKVGEVNALSGKAATAYIQTAVDLCASGYANGMATGPINKEALRAAKLHYIGHTEMISEMSNGKKGITMFQVDNMKIFFHSRHLSLRQALDFVKKEHLVDSIDLVKKCLASIDILDPNIAVAGLNPHSSDGGMFGNEEAEHIIPAIEASAKKGIKAIGPIPADSVFHQAAEGFYDAVLSLYHDQGHIATKCYDFYRVVSVTFGYPFIRTSVDHGTALNIAWKGIANPVSMQEAIVAGFALSRQYKPIY